MSFPSLSSGERSASNFPRDHSNFLRVALIADNSEEADARRLLRRLMDETIEYSIIKIKTAKITPQVFGSDSDAIMLAIASDIQEMNKPEVPIVFPYVTAMSLSMLSPLFNSTPPTPVRFQNHITNQNAGKHRSGSSDPVLLPVPRAQRGVPGVQGAVQEEAEHREGRCAATGKAPYRGVPTAVR